MKPGLPPNPIQWLATSYRSLLGPEQTEGQMSIYESICPPNSGPPRHIHHNEDETFYVLSGELKFCLVDDFSSLNPGSTIFIPRGKEHTFLVLGNQPARMLTILTPGGFEGFFTEMAANQYQIPKDMRQIVEAGHSYNITFSGPPLTIDSQ